MYKEPSALAPTCDEEDWAKRVSYIAARSSRAFAGRPRYSGEWLCTPSAALEGQTPLEALASDRGFEVVQELLTKIEQGIYT